MMNATIGVTTKTVSGSNAVTTIATANGTDPVNGGISNTNKGKNPQSWYYASGWNLFNNYYEDAWKTLQQPNASQTQINTALNQLTVVAQVSCSVPPTTLTALHKVLGPVWVIHSTGRRCIR